MDYITTNSEDRLFDQISLEATPLKSQTKVYLTFCKISVSHRRKLLCSLRSRLRLVKLMLEYSLRVISPTACLIKTQLQRLKCRNHWRIHLPQKF
ncbi:unnamed protein product [Moneuplotes crassus]|uniref:Uncharacterized protein n=1 Tax=Euplotes crassus TaxID=5936 RepID=A0AAD1XIM7_EUPCR|nr:unnamed protein product [Moneuplotes crassus]